MVEPFGFGKRMLLLLPKAISHLFSRRRRHRGSATVELPGVLLILFFFLAFPMLNLATSALRAYFLRSAVLDAAHRAAKACTFITDVAATAEEPFCQSAVNRANDSLDRFAQGFQGISIDTRQVAIVRQDAQTGTEDPPYTSKLNISDIDSEKYLYYVEVSITGKAQPLVSMAGTIIPPIDGLTGPMKLNLTGRELFEQVEGLTE